MRFKVLIVLLLAGTASLAAEVEPLWDCAAQLAADVLMAPENGDSRALIALPAGSYSGYTEETLANWREVHSYLGDYLQTLAQLSHIGSELGLSPNDTHALIQSGLRPYALLYYALCASGIDAQSAHDSVYALSVTRPQPMIEDEVFILLLVNDGHTAEDAVKSALSVPANFRDLVLAITQDGISITDALEASTQLSSREQLQSYLTHIQHGESHPDALNFSQIIP